MSLSELRKKIDVIDREWILLIKCRLEVAKQMAQIKKRDEIPILDREREKGVIERGLQLAQELKMDPQGVEALFHQVLALTKQEMEREQEK